MSVLLSCAVCLVVGFIVGVIVTVKQIEKRGNKIVG
jgi:uncharacterized protein YneF (UPF0154 family)